MEVPKEYIFKIYKSIIEKSKIENQEKIMEIPEIIKNILKKFEEAGFEAYIVGGCVRDFLINKKPKDWDITTNAKPEQIQKLFPKNFYENAFGTVSIITDSNDLTLKIVEVTPFRLEGKYTDKRHPDEIKFADNIEDDLKRRDFTINAIALKIKNGKQIIVDPFDGKKDLKKKVLRAVGNADERFQEDALRILRAIRFAVRLDFQIEEKTSKALEKNSYLLKQIAKERIRDEFEKIIMSENAAKGIYLLHELGLLNYIMPELENCVGVSQNKHHAYPVFDHLVKTLEYAANEHFDLETRLAALLHDVGKPQTKTGEGPESHFYGHDAVSVKLAVNILKRLKFPKETIDIVAALIKSHMFRYNTNPHLGDVTTDSAVRRIIRNVGKDNIWRLINLRLADRYGQGNVKKIEKFDLRHIKARVEILLKEPLSVKDLKINGNDIIGMLKIKPGPKIGWLLSALLQEILDDPKKNEKSYLLEELKRLDKLSDNELKSLADESKKNVNLYNEQAEMEIKEKYFVNMPTLKNKR